jgi:hypothetical protein
MTSLPEPPVTLSAPVPRRMFRLPVYPAPITTVSSRLGLKWWHWIRSVCSSSIPVTATPLNVPVPPLHSSVRSIFSATAAQVERARPSVSMPAPPSTVPAVPGRMVIVSLPRRPYSSSVPVPLTIVSLPSPPLMYVVAVAAGQDIVARAGIVDSDLGRGARAEIDDVGPLRALEAHAATRCP